MERHRTIASVVEGPKWNQDGYHRAFMRDGTDEIVQATFKLCKQISCKTQRRAHILLTVSSLRLARTICRMHNESLEETLCRQPFSLYASTHRQQLSRRHSYIPWACHDTSTLPLPSTLPERSSRFQHRSLLVALRTNVSATGQQSGREKGCIRHVGGFSNSCQHRRCTNRGS